MSRFSGNAQFHWSRYPTWECGHFVLNLFVPKPFRPQESIHLYNIFNIYSIQIPMAMDYHDKTVDKSDRIEA